MSDQLIRAISQDGLIKVSAVSTRDLTERARQIHKTLPVATAALGRLLAGASLMGILMAVLCLYMLLILVSTTILLMTGMGG